MTKKAKGRNQSSSEGKITQTTSEKSVKSLAGNDGKTRRIGRFRPRTPLPEERAYCGRDSHFRGSLKAVVEDNANKLHLTNKDRKRIWRLIDELREQGVMTKDLVSAFLDCAVDLTCTQLPSEGNAYTLFVEATSDLFNHYAAAGVADCFEDW